MSLYNSYEIKLLTLAEEKGWEGDGSKQNPFIIDNLYKIRGNSLQIIKSRLYIVIKNCDFTQEKFFIVLYKSSNVSLFNCKIIGLGVSSCFNIKIGNCIFNSVLGINDCREMQINDSFIYLLRAEHSAEIQMINCEVKRSKTLMVRNSFFKNIEMAERDIKGLNKYENIFRKRILRYLLPLELCFLIMFIFVLFLLDRSSIPILIPIAIGIMLVLIPLLMGTGLYKFYYVKFKKVKDFPENLIITDSGN